MIDKNFYSLREPIALADLASDIGIELPIKGTGDEMIEVPAALMTSLPGSICLLYTSPSPRDKRQSRMPYSA